MPACDYERIERALRFLHDKQHEQPKLRTVARAVHLSEFHFQRLFQRWAGISPKRFLQFLTVEHARGALRESQSVLQVSLAAGLSGPGRLHDLLVAVDAVTPGEWKKHGCGLHIRWGVHPSPFGSCFVAATERGVCALEFLDTDGAEAALTRLRERWHEADIAHAPSNTQALVEQAFAPPAERAPIHLFAKGTNFQLKVWEALLHIPEGCVISYGELAHAAGSPGAARAVGGALARNPVGYLIPCHRVIRALGATGDYRWGAVRKQALLGWEAARQRHPASEPASASAAPAAG